MPIYAAVIGTTAGICLAFGFLFLFVALRRSNRKQQNLALALFALGYAGTLLMGIAYRSTDSLETFMRLARIDSVFVVTAFVSLNWYIASFTDVRPRVYLWGVTAVFLAVGLGNMFGPTMYYSEINGLTAIPLPWGESLTDIDGTPNLWGELFVLGQLATLLFIVTAGAIQYRRGARQESLFLLGGMAWFVLMLGYEILGYLGIVAYVPVAEVGFIGFAVAISLMRANTVIRTEEELAAYKSNLEHLVQERTAELEQAQQQLMEQAQIEERSRLARDLHDAVTQTLYSAMLIAEVLPEVWERDPERGESNLLKLRQLVRGALAEMRTMLFELRPASLATAPLDTLVAQLADSFSGRTRIPIQLNIQGEAELPGAVKVNLYRIVQESFNNIIKHAQADRVALTLNQSPEQVLLTLRDNGRGFDLQATSPECMGLHIMRERAETIGAQLQVESEPGAGTQVSMLWLADGDESENGREEQEQWAGEKAFVS